VIASDIYPLGLSKDGFFSYLIIPPMKLRISYRLIYMCKILLMAKLRRGLQGMVVPFPKAATTWMTASWLARINLESSVDRFQS
jgi:hypothetical protein